MKEEFLEDNNLEVCFPPDFKLNKKVLVENINNTYYFETEVESETVKELMDWLRLKNGINIKIGEKVFESCFVKEIKLGDPVTDYFDLDILSEKINIKIKVLINKNEYR